MTPIRRLTSAEEHQEALERLGTLVESDPPRDSPLGQEAYLLGLVIEDYERQAFPMRFPDPIDAIHFRMEQQGLGLGDLVPILGTRVVVYEVMHRQRRLTLSMIRKIHAALKIPAESLIQPYFLTGKGPYDDARIT